MDDIKNTSLDINKRIKEIRKSDARMADAEYVLRWVHGSPAVHVPSNIHDLAARALELPSLAYGHASRSGIGNVLTESVLRDAIEPVSSWFDIDGEEGEPMSLRSVIAEIAATLSQERNEHLRVRAAARDVVKRHDAGTIGMPGDSVSIEKLRSAIGESH